MAGWRLALVKPTRWVGSESTRGIPINRFRRPSWATLNHICYANPGIQSDRIYIYVYINIYTYVYQLNSHQIEIDPFPKNHGTFTHVYPAAVGASPPSSRVKPKRLRKGLPVSWRRNASCWLLQEGAQPGSRHDAMLLYYIGYLYIHIYI